MEKSLLPEFKPSMEPQRVRLSETPYLRQLKPILKEAANRPISKLNKHRHFLNSILENILFPVLVPLLLGWNCLRYKYSWNWFPQTSVSDMFLAEPVTVGIPLVPLAFPVWWIISNHAALSSVLEIFRRRYNYIFMSSLIHFYAKQN